MPKAVLARLEWTGLLEEVIAAEKGSSRCEARKARLRVARTRARLVRDGLPAKELDWAKRRALTTTVAQIVEELKAADEKAKVAFEERRNAAHALWCEWAKRAAEKGVATIAPAASDAAGAPLSDVGQLGKEAAVWDKIWRHASECAPPPEEVPRGTPLPRPDVAAIRAAGKSFAMMTGTGIDDAHPRVWALLKAELIELFIDMGMLIEDTGILPEKVRLIVMRLMPKAAGGVRPIALMASFVRVWAKGRRPDVKWWEADNARACFQVRCIDAVFDQRLHDEAARAMEDSSATI